MTLPVIALIFFLFSHRSDSLSTLLTGTPGVYLALGWVGLVFAQLLSTLVARAGWWAAKR